MYKQASGIFMGTAPAPDLAKDFAFMHEHQFRTSIVMGEYYHLHERHEDRSPRCPFAMIEQYEVSTKRYIDDMFTASL